MISGVSPILLVASTFAPRPISHSAACSKADPRRGDQRRVAALPGKVRIGALVEQEARPLRHRCG